MTHTYTTEQINDTFVAIKDGRVYGSFPTQEAVDSFVADPSNSKLYTENGKRPNLLTPDQIRAGQRPNFTDLE